MSKLADKKLKKEMHTENLKCEEPNNCCILKDGSVVSILKFSEDDNCTFVGSKHPHIGNFFDKPCPSKKIGIQIVGEHRNKLNSWHMDDIKEKLWKMPYKGNYVVFPIIHTRSH